jgi:hypothetical protein
MNGNNSAANSAFAGQPDLETKFARFIVKSAGLHNGVNPFGLALV